MLGELQRKEETSKRAGCAPLLPTTKDVLGERTHEVFDLDAVQTTAQINRGRIAASGINTTSS